MSLKYGFVAQFIALPVYCVNSRAVFQKGIKRYVDAPVADAVYDVRVVNGYGPLWWSRRKSLIGDEEIDEARGKLKGAGSDSRDEVIR